MAVNLFVLGGSSFWISGIFIYKRYFLEEKKYNQSIGEES
jgi:hypothetical protein